VLKPLELLGGAALAAIFVGVIALMGTRDFTFAVIATGVVFIIVLVVSAMFSLAVGPDEAEVADLDEQNHEGDDRRAH
jgi:hypothetical protein